MSAPVAGSLPSRDQSADRHVPSVVVIDPQFDAYKSLAASARLGRIRLHLRSSGSDAMKLARRLHVDAWLIAPELDDMSGHDLVQLLKLEQGDAGSASSVGDSKFAMVDASHPGGRQRVLAEAEATDAGADSVLSHPISLADLETLLELPADARSQALATAGHHRPYVTLPIGVGAAVIAIAVLMMG
jgi:CheY-like chemotaxis protein